MCKRMAGWMLPADAFGRECENVQVVRVHLQDPGCTQPQGLAQVHRVPLGSQALHQKPVHLGVGAEREPPRFTPTPFSVDISEMLDFGV